ncbi:hypothetical protein C8Q75DRAFT_806197 [Abortiporus biennis]|nr:hypothetical protein C8Q75DRAFT_806197 [Abortiporus biennis]
MKILYVIHASATMTSTIKNAFTGHSWPQVCSVMLPTSASAILSCCPNVEEVSCSHGDGDKLIGPMTKFCKKVHSLHGFNLRVGEGLSEIADLRYRPISQLGNIPDFIYNLSEFAYLTTIALDVWAEHPKDLDNIQEVKTAQKVLQENKATGKKRLILRYGWKDGDPEYPQWKYIGTKTMSVS